MDSILADVRQSFRMMRKDPGFTLIAIAALALGIGANIAIFSVVDKVLLQPLPYPQPDRLVMLGQKEPNGTQYATSIPKYMAWRNNTVFSAMAAYDQEGPGLDLSTAGAPVQIKGLHVSVEFFSVFGIRPLKGRAFSASEGSPHGVNAAIISEALWRSRFGADPHMIGKTIVLNAEPYPVVGLMPASFVADPPADVWIPLQADPADKNHPEFLAVAARLRNGIALDQARAEMKLVGERFRRANPSRMEKRESVAVTPMRDVTVEDVRTALLVLVAAVIVVLLIACSDVANLLLARAASRQGELAIRAALGASRCRLIRQLLTESVLLALLGGAAGLVLGVWGIRALLLLVPGAIPRLTDARQIQNVLSVLDGRIALFTLAASLLTGLIIGVLPAFQLTHPNASTALKEAASRSGSGRHHNLIRKTLVGVETALALVLLTAAALLLQTFRALSYSNPGIDPSHVVTMLTSLTGAKYSTTASVDKLAIEVTRRLETLPGVAVASLSVGVPTETDIDLPFTISGKPPKAGDDYNGDEQYRFVTPHYFAVFRIPLLRGRLFAASDQANAAKVVLINQSMAHKYWRNENPLGQVITISHGLGPAFEEGPRQIIGVIGDVRETGLDDKDLCVMYVPQTQVPNGITQEMNSSIPLVWSIRTSMDALSVRKAAERAFRAADGQLGISEFRTMRQVLARSMARQRFNMLVVSIFAGFALLLGAMGVYGVMSYSVKHQTPELGIRMALGAGRRDILGLILWQGMTPSVLGVLVGLGLTLGVSRLLASLLYGVKATDPFTVGSVALILLAVALFATYIPARRALGVDPLLALRDDG